MFFFGDLLIFSEHFVFYFYYHSSDFPEFFFWSLIIPCIEITIFVNLISFITWRILITLFLLLLLPKFSSWNSVSSKLLFPFYLVSIFYLRGFTYLFTSFVFCPHLGISGKEQMKILTCRFVSSGIYFKMIFDKVFFLIDSNPSLQVFFLGLLRHPGVFRTGCKILQVYQAWRASISVLSLHILSLFSCTKISVYFYSERQILDNYNKIEQIILAKFCCEIYLQNVLDWYLMLLSRKREHTNLNQETGGSRIWLQ